MGFALKRTPWKDKWLPAHALKWCETQQFAQSVSDVLTLHESFEMHIIHGQIRIPQRYGGDPDVTQEIWVCNDTGSSTLSIFNSDLTALGFDPKWWYANSGHRTKIVVLVSAQSHSRDVSIEICCSCSSYIGHSSSHYCSSANGLVWLAHVSIEMQVLTSASVPLTPWFEQLAVVKQWGPNEARLSGDGMRDHLFFATSPGNRNLYVSTRKAGLMRVLPA